MSLYQNLANFMNDKLDMEFTYKPLTHIAREHIFRHLPFEPRKKLAARYQAVEDWHSKFPFKFKKVKFELVKESPKDKEHRKISLDGLTWKIYDNGDDTQTIVKPCGQERHFNYICDKTHASYLPWFIALFMFHYFHREGTQIEEFHVKNHPMQYGHFLSMNIRKLHIEVLPDHLKDINVVFLSYFKHRHIEKITIDAANFSGFLMILFNDYEVTTDSITVKDDNFFKFRKIGEMTRKIQLVNSDGNWRELCIAATEFRRDLLEKYCAGSYYKGIFESMPYLEDFLDTLRIDFNGEFKYSEDIIGVCAEMTGNRELFIHHQLINDENMFTAEILEKGTTKHYHQLPMDQQKKFRDKEDDRNRVRVIKDNDKEEKLGMIIRRVGLSMLNAVW